MNEEEKEGLTRLINAELKKGTMLHVEVEYVLGTDIVGMKVNMEGNALALLKMLISAMATHKQLNTLIKAAAAASKIVDVDAVKLNVKNQDEKGGEA